MLDSILKTECIIWKNLGPLEVIHLIRALYKNILKTDEQAYLCAVLLLLMKLKGKGKPRKVLSEKKADGDTS